MSSSQSAWMARAGNENELAGELRKHDVVAVGWDAVGDLSDVTTRSAVKQRYAEAHPDHSKNRRAQNSGQLYRFSHVMETGDLVLTYLKAEREYRVGRISDAYEFRPDLFEDYPHVRPVEWIDTIPRDDFSTSARNSLGSTLTVFSLDGYVEEIESLLFDNDQTSDDSDDEEAPPLFEEVKSQSDELIADLIAQLDPYDFEELVAATLRAMGFQANTTSAGPDRGIDVIAHPDAFGFEKPLIKAQVKHVSSTIGSPEMQSFIGALGNTENGLYVSTGGFTKSARREADRAGTPLQLLDRDEFIELLLQNYEDLESEYKSWIPLRRVWIPTKS